MRWNFLACLWCLSSCAGFWDPFCCSRFRGALCPVSWNSVSVEELEVLESIVLFGLENLFGCGELGCEYLLDLETGGNN